jgi:predicted secreted protein
MMKTSRTLVVLGGVVVLLCALSACALFPVRITDEDSGSIQAVSVGDVVRIRLSGNPTTGYAWTRVDPESLEGTPLEVLQEGDCWPSHDAAGPAGAPGWFVFNYRAAEEGTVTLTFAYQKSWEEEPIDTFTVTIWVR